VDTDDFRRWCERGLPFGVLLSEGVRVDGDELAEVVEDALDEEVDDFRLEFDDTGVMEIRSECCGEDVTRCWSGC
jgi:hypothetical protein